MSVFLYRLGRLAFRRRWVFIVPWVIALAATLALASMNGAGAISSNVTIDGTPSQAVLDELRAELPAAAGGQGTIVFTAPDGERLDDGAAANAIATAAHDISALPEVAQRPAASSATPPAGATTPGAAPPADAAHPTNGSRPLVVNGAPVPGALVSVDGSVVMLQIQFEQQVDDLPEGAVDEVVDTARAAVDGTGVAVLPSSSLTTMHAPIGGHEAIGLGVAALVLLLTLGSLIAAGLPLLTAITGVGIGLGGAIALSQNIELTSATPVLALMVGLAVGIDYALFIVNRQRRLILTEGISAERAAGRALGTAGSAVVFAGATVIVALSALSIIGISFLTTMALVAAVTVLFAVLIALTLLPALLGLVGERVVSARARRRGRELVVREHRGLAHRYASLLVRRPWAVIVTIVVILGAAAVPIGSMSLGMPSGSTANTDTAERQSYDAITRGFGEGYNAPLVVTVRPDDARSLDQGAMATVTRELTSMPDVTDARLLGAKPDGSIAVFTVIPDEGPLAESTAELVHAIRSPDAAAASAAGATLGVTGLTAVNIDISEKLAAVLPAYIAIIVVISLLILLLVFRSILVPIKATAGFLLTILATFGLTTAVFEWGWLKELFGFDTTGPLLSFLPIMVTGILYGLAMDYEVFLVSSMRQAHVHGHRGKDGIVHGFDQVSRVVVAAAVIMVSVFAGFIFTDDPTIKQLGLALAVGILIDAFLVRITLVPALMAVVGRAAWALPGWLDRLLPHLDIEGDRLNEYIADPANTAPSAGSRRGRHRRSRRNEALPLGDSPGILTREESLDDFSTNLTRIKVPALAGSHDGHQTRNGSGPTRRRVNMTTHPNSAADHALAETLISHHGELVAQLDGLTSAMVASPDDAAAKQAVIDWIHASLLPHATEEENTSYAAAAALNEGTALINAMVREHGTIKRIAHELHDASGGYAAGLARSLYFVFVDHQAKENEVVLPMLLESPDVNLTEVMAAHLAVHGHDAHGHGGHDHHH